MAVTPLSPDSGNKAGLKMPMPPPLLHTRSGNELYQRPQTPTQNSYMSPNQTPQGSPSKKQMPPGANDLPNVFENALKLAPMPPSGQPKSPGKQGLSLADVNVNKDPFADQTSFNGVPSSPTRQSNKENTPQGPYSPGKGIGYQQNQAALSRQELYTQKDTKKDIAQTRGLTAEELQKLQQPKVKRLANVTQLCKRKDCVEEPSMLIWCRFP